MYKAGGLSIEALTAQLLRLEIDERAAARNVQDSAVSGLTDDPSDAPMAVKQLLTELADLGTVGETPPRR
jgi:hypothetical protein